MTRRLVLLGLFASLLRAHLVIGETTFAWFLKIRLIKLLIIFFDGFVNLGRARLGRVWTWLARFLGGGLRGLRYDPLLSTLAFFIITHYAHWPHFRVVLCCLLKWTSLCRGLLLKRYDTCGLEALSPFLWVLDSSTLWNLLPDQELIGWQRIAILLSYRFRWGLRFSAHLPDRSSPLRSL